MLKASLVLAVLLWGISAPAFDVPQLRGAVNDYAGVIPARTEKLMEAALADFRRRGGAHIAVLTVEDLQGETIEQASIQVTDRWQLGSANEDNGVLLMLASRERQVRIEVGQGLEGVLTDAHANRIIEDAMIPLFRQGEIAQGLLIGTYQIAQRTNPDLSLYSQQESRAWRAEPSRGFRFKDIIIILIFIFFFIFGGRSPLFAFLLGSQLGRRSYGGGFGRGGSGGFSGGGGGFSGGGASGSW